MQQVKQFAFRKPNVVQKPKAETIQLKPVGKVLQQIPLSHSQVPEYNSILLIKEEFQKLQYENEQLRHQLNTKYQDYDKKVQIMNEVLLFLSKLAHKLEGQLKRRESDINYYIHKIEYKDKEIKQQKELIAKLRNKKKDYKMKFLALQQQQPQQQQQQQQDHFHSLLGMRELLLQFRLTAQVLPLLQLQQRLRQYQSQIIDVDNMNYEQLLSLGEQIGNVSNGMTREDIRRIPKREIQASDNIQGVCPVCQCNMEIGEKYRRLGCNHHYHAKCIKTWLLQHNNCPVCKQSVVIAN